MLSSVQCSREEIVCSKHEIEKLNIFVFVIDSNKHILVDAVAALVSVQIEAFSQSV